MTPMWRILIGRICNFRSTGHCLFIVKGINKRVTSIPVIGTVSMRFRVQHLPE